MFKRIIAINKRFFQIKNSSEYINKVLSIPKRLFTIEETKATKVDRTKLNFTENINKIVSKSLKKELDNFYPIDENQLKQILNEKGFNLVNEIDSKTFKLEKKLEEKTLRIIITPKQPDLQSENEGK